MESNRQTALALQQESKAAYEAGDPHDSSPYNRFGKADQQFGCQYWTRGCVMARSAAEESGVNPSGLLVWSPLVDGQPRWVMNLLVTLHP